MQRRGRICSTQRGSPSWRRRLLPQDPRASEAGAQRGRQDLVAGVGWQPETGKASFSKRVLGHASDGGGLHRFRRVHPRRAPPRAPAGILAGWTQTSPMLIMDHKDLFPVPTILPTSKPGTHTCIGFQHPPAPWFPQGFQQPPTSVPMMHATGNGPAFPPLNPAMFHSAETTEPSEQYDDEDEADVEEVPPP